MKEKKILKYLKGFESVENMETRNGAVSKNQTIVYFSNGSVFYSYGTLIAVKYNDRIYLTTAYKYSVTTNRYRNRFLGNTLKEVEDLLESGEYKILEKK